MNIDFQEYKLPARVLIHVGTWLGMFILLLLLLRVPLQGDELDFSFSLYVTILLAVVALNHYSIAYGFPKLVQENRWGAVALWSFALYLGSSFISIQGIYLLNRLFPHNSIYQTLFAKYGLHSFWDLFSLRTFTWLMSFVFPFCVFTLLLKFYKKNQEITRRNLTLQRTNSELELDFLRSQINPHFFFNTLNGLYALVFDNDKAAQMILGLSDIMRFSLYETKVERISLARECRFLTDYIRLEQMRYDERVVVEYEFRPNADNAYQVPPLLLINFVENAFKHGVYTTLEKAWVKIRLHCQEDVLHFTVANSKPSAIHPRQPPGIGIQNTQRRLDIIYPKKHQLHIEETPDSFTVTLTITLI